MALIVTPGTTADSFASVEFILAYLDTRDPDGLVQGLKSDAIENHARRATELLDGLKWNGAKVEATNSLRWPRQYVYDKDTILLDSTTIPLFLQRATSEFVFALANTDTTDTDTGFKKIDIGSLKMEMESVGVNDGPIPEQVLRMVQFYQPISGAVLVRG